MVFGAVQSSVRSRISAGYVAIFAMAEGYALAGLLAAFFFLLSRGGPMSAADPGAIWWSAGKFLWAAAFFSLGVGIRRVHPVGLSPFAVPGIAASVAACWLAAAGLVLETWAILAQQWAVVAFGSIFVGVLLNVSVYAVCCSLVVSVRERERHALRAAQLKTEALDKLHDSALSREPAGAVA